MLSVTEVDRVSITTVVDNYVDVLRQDEKVARRFSAFAARQMPDLRAEHGLAHYVEVARGRETVRIAFDFGSSETALTHNFRALGLDASAIDVLALSHGHWDHWGGLAGMLRTYRRAMKRDLTFYGGEDHFLARFNQRGADRVNMGRLHRDEIERATGHRLRVVKALVRDVGKEREFPPAGGVLTEDANEILEDPSIPLIVSASLPTVMLFCNSSEPPAATVRTAPSRSLPRICLRT